MNTSTLFFRALWRGSLYIYRRLVSSGEEEANVLVDLLDAVGSRISCGQYSTI